MAAQPKSPPAKRQRSQLNAAISRQSADEESSSASAEDEENIRRAAEEQFNHGVGKAIKKQRRSASARRDDDNNDEDGEEEEKKEEEEEEELSDGSDDDNDDNDDSDEKNARQMNELLMGQLFQTFKLNEAQRQKVRKRNQDSGKLSMDEMGLHPTFFLKGAPQYGGQLVELTNRQGRFGVFVHQQHLLREELQQYWQDCAFPWRVLRVTRVEGDKITIEGESQLTSDLKYFDRHRISVTDTLDGFRKYLTADVMTHLGKCNAPQDLPQSLGRADQQGKSKRGHQQPDKSLPTILTPAAPLLSFRCLPGVHFSDWVRQTVHSLVGGPREEMLTRIDWGPSQIGLPPNQGKATQPFLDDVTALPLSTHIVLLVMHVKEQGVPLLWRKEDVTGWRYDEAERIFPLTRVLEAFIRQRRCLTLILISCGLSKEQRRQLQQLAQKTQCTFVVNIRQEVLYQEPTDPLFSEFARLGAALLSQQMEQEMSTSSAPLSTQQVLAAVRAIVHASASDTVIIDSNGRAHEIHSAAADRALPTQMDTDTVRSQFARIEDKAACVAAALAPAPAAAAASASTSADSSSALSWTSSCVSLTDSKMFGCAASIVKTSPHRAHRVATIEWNTVEFPPQLEVSMEVETMAATTVHQSCHLKFLKFRVCVDGQPCVLLYTNSELLGHSGSFRELLKRIPDRKHTKTVQLTRIELEKIAAAFTRHASLSTPFYLFQSARTRVITTVFHLPPDEWQCESALERMLMGLAVATLPLQS